MSYRGALILSSGSQSIPRSPYYGPIWKFLVFGNVGHNTEAALDPADRKFEIVQETDPDRTYFVMKGSGIARFRVNGIWFPRLPVSPNTFFPGEGQLVVTKNQDTPLPLNGYPGMIPDNCPFIQGTTTDHQAGTHPIPFVDGDKFCPTACQYQETGDQALLILACGFSVEVLAT